MQATLASRGIDAAQLGAILRMLLSQGAESDHCLAERYLSEDDPLSAILHDPTDTVEHALARLRLVMAIKAWYEAAKDQALQNLEKAHQLALGDDERASIDAFGQIDHPDFLRDLALHAKTVAVRIGSLMKLHTLNLLHGPDMRCMLEEIAAHDTELAVRGRATLLLRNLSREEPKPKRTLSRPRDLRHSILNPDLEALCACGMLDPADPDDLDLIEYLYRDLDCTEFGKALLDQN